jgi:hypothetical protein
MQWYAECQDGTLINDSNINAFALLKTMHHNWMHLRDINDGCPPAYRSVVEASLRSSLTSTALVRSPLKLPMEINLDK